MSRHIFDELIRRHNRTVDLLFLTLVIACIALGLGILALFR